VKDRGAKDRGGGGRCMKNPEVAQLEARVIDLETRITFLEATLEQLDGVVTKQADTLDAVTGQLKSALMQLRGMAFTKDNEPPPHY
jgi:uncharacterized coiled-coil protein SlyX